MSQKRLNFEKRENITVGEISANDVYFRKNYKLPFITAGTRPGNLHLINVQDATDERVYCFNDDDESLETSTLEFYDSLTDFKDAMESLL